MIAIKHITLGALLLLTVTSQAMAQSMLIKGASILDVVSGDLIDKVSLSSSEAVSNTLARQTQPPSPVESARPTRSHNFARLIDMHVHLTSGGGYHGYERLKLTDERRAILGVVHANKR